MTDVRVDGREYSAIEVCDITGINYGQLNHWSRIGLLEPSIQSARGRGTRRRFSFADMRCAMAIAPLSAHEPCRDSAALLRVRRLVVEKYREQPCAEYVVIVDAREAFLCSTAEEVVAVAKQGTVAIVIRPGEDQGTDVVKLSAESMTSPPGAGPTPRAASSRRSASPRPLSHHP